MKNISEKTNMRETDKETASGLLKKYIMLLFMGVLLVLIGITSYAQEPMIERIEETSPLDENGFTTITVNVSEKAELPMSITLKGKEGKTNLSVSKNGLQYKIKPGTYKVKKAVSESGKHYDTGAYLTIQEKGGNVFLDFTKPEGAGDGLTAKNVLLTNVIFLILGYLAVKGFLWYREHLA